MTDNMQHWNRLKQPPPHALKEITGGRLRGMTDINPQWRYQALTEEFGPCGDGWKYTIEELWMTDGKEPEKTAWAKILLYIRYGEAWSDPIPGIGGSMYITEEKSGPRTNDEAYKMAVTDALSVAFKVIGGASDIYAGLWDGSKYNKGKTEKTAPDEDSQQNVCPECGKAAIIKGKEEYGGGWLCYKRKDGCGAKWTDEEWNILKDNPGQEKHNFMKEMLKFQASLDAITYSKVLGEHGFTTAHEITERADMENVYIAMKEAKPIDIDEEKIPY